MLDLHRRLRLCEVELQCRFVLKAYGLAAIAVERRDSEGFWLAVQSLLTAAAQINRFLREDSRLCSALDAHAAEVLTHPDLEAVLDSPAALNEWMAAHPKAPLRLSNFGPFGVSRAEADVFARYAAVEDSAAVVFGRHFDISALAGSAAALNEAVKTELSVLRALV